MRRIDKPMFDVALVYAACISGVKRPELATRLTAATDEMLALAQDYETLASAHQLYQFDACDWGGDAQLIFGDLSKKELTELYSKYMVGEGGAGRAFYDRLMMLAPLGKCPFCGVGHASTLDHFLSKARYPSFSVLVSNLVPACSDCNKGKGSSVLTAENQVLHPYYENVCVEHDEWLFSEVIESTPATVKFFVMPPDTWPPDLCLRVKNHFADLSLASRYAVEAASELASISDLFMILGSCELRRKHLSSIAIVEREKRTNSWKAALYEALSTNNWFQELGYQRSA